MKLQYAAMAASAPSAAVAAAAPAQEETPGFVLSWETVVVATEIITALSTSLFLLYRKAKIDRNAPPASVSCSSSTTITAAGSPIMQACGFCSLDALLSFRLAALAFYVVVQLYDIYRTRLACLLFYTSWNFIAQGVYFGIAAARTLQVRRLQQGSRRGYAPLLDETRSTGAATGSHHGWIRLELALDVCLATSILISVIVWTILYPYAVKMHYPEKFLNWVSYSQHALNVVFLQVDFLSTRHAVSLRALPLLIAWPSVYSVFTWILHGTVAKGFWPYPFMEVNTPYAPLWYVGLLVAHTLGFAIVYAISRCKASDGDVASSSSNNNSSSEL